MKLEQALAISMGLFLVTMSVASAGGVQGSNYIHIENMTMRFDGSDANITVEYRLDFFAKLYMLLFGPKVIEPKLEGIFAEFENATIKEISQEKAVIVAINVLVHKGETYHINPYKLGQEVDILVIVFPDNYTITFNDRNTVPSITYSY